MKRVVPLFFLLPIFILILLFYIIPALSTIYISTTDMGRGLKGDFVGLKNFASMFSMEDPVIGRILLNTFVYLFGVLAVTIIGGFLLAITTTSLGDKAGSFFRVLWFLPRAMPPVVWAYLWIWTFDPTRYGLLNMILNLLGFPGKSWILLYSMVIVIFANGILGIPYTMTILSAAIKNIPIELIEAARIDGASAWKTVMKIKVPLIWWPLAFLTIWHTLAALTTFQYIYMITAGGPFYSSTPLGLYTYSKAFVHMELGYGAALALVLILVNGIIIFAFRPLFGLKKKE